jgi:DNA-binding GntR family transcriptional regulator
VIKRKSDEAYAALRRRIMCAELPPGAPLDERELMEALGVGRTPLREAVLRLEHERLVRSLGRRGYIVAETSPLDLFRAFELRREIECFGAACAAERRTDADLEAFDAFLARAEADMERMAGNMPWNLEADEEFHRLVAEASDNRFVSETLAYLYGLSVRSLYTSRVPATLVRDEIAIYREVRDAIARRDRAAAADAMGRHLTVSPIGTVFATGATPSARREVG